MGGSQQSLLNTLDKVIAAFNTNIAANVDPYLDENVNVFGIHHQTPHSDKTSSELFLQQCFKDHPHFELLTKQVEPGDDNLNAAKITGKAKWKDDHDRGHGQSETLSYDFRCRYVENNPDKSVNGGWLFTRVHAQVV